MKDPRTAYSHTPLPAAHSLMLALLVAFASIVLLDFSPPEFTFSSTCAIASADTSLPCHNENGMPQLHRDAVPPLISQLTNSNPTCARTLSRNQVSHSSIVREIIRKNFIYNKFHIQQQTFRTHIAQQVANGAHTYRCGVLII